jgi:ribosomal protein S18 acetylase RimI-like enzyme
VIRALEVDELEAGAKTLAASFHDDPLFGYMIPKAAKRARFLDLVMQAVLSAALPEGHVVTTADGPELGIMGVIPPGRFPVPSKRLRQFAFAKWRWLRAPFPSYRLLRAGIGMLNALDRLHIDEPHYYLQVIGVHPDAKGRGIGGALVRHVVGLADSDRVPVYLETSNEINLGFYRRFGFEVAEEFACPGGGPMNWTMLRQAT